MTTNTAAAQTPMFVHDAWYVAMYADASYVKHGINGGFRDEEFGQYDATTNTFWSEPDEYGERREFSVDHADKWLKQL